MITKKQILENRKILQEDALETSLMLAGFVPVIGEIADIILIIRFLYKKEYLYAALMLVALIPTVGDFIAKPFISVLKSSGVGTKIMLKSSDDLVKLLSKNPEAKKQFLKLSEHFGNKGVNKTINNIYRVNNSWGQKLSYGLNQLKTTASKLKPAQLANRIGKEVSTGGTSLGKTLTGGGPVARGLKGFFRDEKLAQYVAKKGMEPSTWLSRWWNVTMKGRQSRRNMFRSIVSGSEIAKKLGLPNLSNEKLDQMMNDKKFLDELSNDKSVSDFISQNTDSKDLSSIENVGNNSLGGGIFGSILTIGLLKALAKKYV